MSDLKLVGILVGFTALFFISACGVKGDPLPPEKPVEIGRGRPTYKRAFRDIQMPDSTKDDNTGDEEENENSKKQKAQ